MAETMAAGAAARRPAAGAGAVALGLLAAALAVAAFNLAAAAPVGRWLQALLAPDVTDMRELVLRYSALPRIAVALLCGAGLGLSGALLQQVLRNPLAEPGTLGVFAGARFALYAGTLWAPGLLAYGYEPLALVGGAASMALVLALARGRGFAPFAVVLAGLIVSLALEAANKMLAIGNFEQLSDLMIWQAGSLAQNDWSAAAGLAPRIAVAALAAALISRPLAVLDLDESGARSLGVPLAWTRFAAVTVAVLVSASVVGAVGAIGFVGLAGPAIARAAGARSLRQRLVWGAGVSAGVLLLTDQALVATTGGTLPPTGAVTALLGAPLLLWLVWRFRSTGSGERGGEAPGRRGVSAAGIPRVLLTLAPLAAVAVLLALSLGRTPDGGWRWATGSEIAALSTWRGPRVAASLAAGFMLSVSGGILQRISGNPMASPELLGVSAGAAIALIATAFLAPGLGYGGSLAIAALGAFASLAMVLAIGRRSAFAPMRMLLIGVGLTALLNAAVESLLVAGDPRTAQLLTWLAGSTYAVTASLAAGACVAAALAALALPFAARWLAILPLGDPPAQALGLSVGRSRLALLVFASALTAVSTVLVGPLSFVGLMGPHLSRLFGARTALAESLAAGLIGAILMALADWIGRNAIYPWQIPAGVVATALGGLYFLWLMKSKR
ncbi:Fe(3+)-hydroxamate ABC transporter permease FhuB [Hansschlegelia plantiphila]|uniref:Fe3+-hydroxamate ABC transporter permease FhuB n=1 Tax=Hansschlegelia plantiphila TaxID=374655 RepID=A0A9W6J3F0_9HYPH|nr:Fe(3+)-hydroxamate ABC transporter permease FhuB [Hansschlegelia plantiphila]GLK69607.1 Fe3+-hydroxamate ABC transporter permease FhuB [Hansschlegelia plantiphila]